jgi:hypothetical protein
MALRLLPFRQYNETDVINLYKVVPTGTNSMASPFVNGGNDNGVLVKVSAGDFTLDPVSYEANTAASDGGNYLGKTDYPFIGRDQYPTVNLAVNEAASGQAGCLGVTLRQTLTYDENGEKLLYNPQKAIEMQAVLTGQAVPVLTKGVITLDNATAFSTAPTAVGQKVYPGGPGGGGQFQITTDATPDIDSVGTVIATGNRINRGYAPDYFAGASVGTGNATTAGAFSVVKLDVS